MTINGKVHCLFEQSGTFKNEFIKLGFPAEDYDIQNNFGQTDHIIDLFHQIFLAYNQEPSIFDQFSSEDLIMAFFPCIFFCEDNMLKFRFEHKSYARKTRAQVIDSMIKRSRNRQYFHEIILKLFYICESRGLRLIVENTYSTLHYLYYNFTYRPSLIDRDRSLRGDYFKKPTQYWFINCEHTVGYSLQPRKPKPVSHIPGRFEDTNTSDLAKDNIYLCAEERSMVHPDYARNFICDFILGKKQPHTMPELFREE